MQPRPDEVNEVLSWFDAVAPGEWSRLTDSAAAAQVLAARLSHRRNIRLTGKILIEHASPERLARWIVDNADAVYDPLVRFSHKSGGGSDLPLIVCIHALTGHAGIYRRLAQELDGTAEVVGLQARGLKPGESPYPRFDALLDDYLQRVIEMAQDRPINLLGFSSGGAIAHSLAGRVLGAGYPAGPVFVLDTLLYTNPEIPGFSEFLSTMYRGIHRHLTDQDLEAFSRLGDEDRLRIFIEALVQVDVTERSAMSKRAMERIGAVMYGLHCFHRAFEAKYYQGGTILVRSSDAGRWGDEFIAWEPPSAEIVRERIACLHASLLYRPHALRRLGSILNQHAARTPRLRPGSPAP